jgi:membrane-bound ClpP family serine protease
MRSVNLMKVAIEAEILRYKSMAARQGRRAGFGVAALIFGLGFLITLEIAGWQTIRMYILPIYATLCVMGFNLLIAAAFAMVALRSSPSRAEIDALEVRKKAVQALQTTMMISGLVPTAGYLWRRRGNKRRQARLR